MSTPPRSPPLDVEDLYRTYGAVVRARVRRFFHGDEAEDVVQEVFVRVLDKKDSFRGESSPVTWLYQLTTRHCLNRLRDGTRHRALREREGGIWWSPPKTPADQEAQAQLRQLLGTLDEETAQIAVYFHLDGMTRDDVAALMGCSPRTIGYRLEALRELVAARGGG